MSMKQKASRQLSRCAMQVTQVLHPSPAGFKYMTQAYAGMAKSELRSPPPPMQAGEEAFPRQCDFTLNCCISSFSFAFIASGLCVPCVP